MSEKQASRPSRWDAIRREDETQSSSRRQPTNNSRRGHNHYQGRGKQREAYSSHPGSSRDFNWRRRTFTDTDICDNNTPQKVSSVEAEAVKEAIQNLQIAILSFLDEKQNANNERSNEGLQRAVHNTLAQLSASLFGTSDFLEHPCCMSIHIHQLNTTKSLTNISNDVIWEATYSLLRHIKLISQTDENKNAHLQCIQRISLLVLHCLQSFMYNLQHHVPNAQCTKPKTMTDLRLCKCAMIIFDTLGCKGLFDDNATNMNEMMVCKGFLVSCLAKIMSISTMNGRASPPSNTSKNTRERARGPLFPWGAEKTVDLVVKGTILPLIEVLTGRGDASVSKKAKYCYGAMECLLLLLGSPKSDSFNVIGKYQSSAHLSKHAAAILAPLIVDVSPDGKENQRSNPLRSKTLSAISSFWEWSYEVVLCTSKNQQSVEERDHANTVLMSCNLLAAALNALSVLRKSKAQKTIQNGSYEMDVSSIARQLHSLILNEDLQSYRPQYLIILGLLCSAYPSASASQWHLFLEQSAVKDSLLLSILERGTFVLESECFEDDGWIFLPSALHVTSTLLSVMPFSLWISGDTKPSMRMTGGNFACRVRNALGSLMNCAFNLMVTINGKLSSDWLPSNNVPAYTTSMESVLTEVSELAVRLCKAIPFRGENSILLDPASKLLQCAGDIYVNSVNTITSKPFITKAELESTLLYKTMSNFSHVIVQSLEHESTPSPSEQWLSNASSYEFIRILFSDSCWTHPLSRGRMDILSAVAKYSPGTLAREPFNLASFCSVCAAQCKSPNNEDSRILGLKLIESFIIGRKQHLMQCTANLSILSAIRETFCPVLLAALEDNSAAVRTCAVSSFGALACHDWVGLIMSESKIDWAPLESILRLCNAVEEKIASVRSASCKAIGDISSECIIEAQCSDDFILSYTCKISKVMANALTDEVASVRSMALFAIGNTALALKEHYGERPSPSSSFMNQIFPSVCKCLEDRDEKVVANAIRSISHTAYFVYHKKQSSDMDSNSAAIGTYTALLSQLTAKIDFAIDDGLGQSPKALTWKQRNGAKKQSWGSCSTLGVLLDFSHMLPNLDILALKSALASLFRCLQYSNVINDKITAASVNALLGLPKALWQHVSCKCDSIGRGLATCFGFLHDRDNRNSQLGEIESMTHLLLLYAKKTDFCNLFLIQESIPFSVEFFYQWLVTHEIEASIYEEITATVSSPSVASILDISVAQMFTSRTIQQQRREGSPCKANQTSLLLDEGEEEGDEL